MKQLIINVPDDKLDFFTELVKQLQLELVDYSAPTDEEK
ncbi:MAG: hypothetical protein ACI85I_000803 [Arenicella sp.]|jgi:hypothetical protein